MEKCYRCRTQLYGDRRKYNYLCQECEDKKKMGISRKELDELIKWNNWELHDILIDIEQDNARTIRDINKRLTKEHINSFKKYGEFTKKEIIQIVKFYLDREIERAMYEQYKATVF